MPLQPSLPAGTAMLPADTFADDVVLITGAGTLGMAAATEFARLAFQSLMQQLAPGGAHGRVFVRYEVVFQLSWVLGALIPAMLPLGFREGFLILFGMYVVVGLGYLTPDLVPRRRTGSPPD